MVWAGIFVVQTLWFDLGGIEQSQKEMVEVFAEMGWFSYDGKIIIKA